MNPRARTALEELQELVCNFTHVRESFSDRFTAEQLLAIHRAWLASEHDIAPDEWTERQIRAALEGIAPAWDENLTPIHSANQRSVTNVEPYAPRVGDTIITVDGARLTIDETDDNVGANVHAVSADDLRRAWTHKSQIVRAERDGEVVFDRRSTP